MTRSIAVMRKEHSRAKNFQEGIRFCLGFFAQHFLSCAARSSNSHKNCFPVSFFFFFLIFVLLPLSQFSSLHKKMLLELQMSSLSKIFQNVSYVVFKYICIMQTPPLERGGARAGIFKLGSQEPSRNRVAVPARQATQAGGIGSLKQILGLLKSLKIRTQAE